MWFSLLNACCLELAVYEGPLNPLLTVFISRQKLTFSLWPTVSDSNDLLWWLMSRGDCYIRVQASISEAVVRWNCLPGKMNPVVRPLMDSLRREENFELQVSRLAFVDLACFWCESQAMWAVDLLLLVTLWRFLLRNRRCSKTRCRRMFVKDLKMDTMRT